ncbi:MAG: hypothetical protein N0E48_19400, partial [Candidatus Thiodiazotropha endolucinida]|nr:hypothetical protein [Candidatus Thiodiazotropha taylori]MCW4345504.1 hypothetical protein [Candidatus Thiodiazotropha endolucinida]
CKEVYVNYLGMRGSCDFAMIRIRVPCFLLNITGIFITIYFSQFLLDILAFISWNNSGCL